MKLVNKQLVKEICKNKVFVLLTMLMSALTSFMYFFVHFSIDGNMLWLTQIEEWNEGQLLYKNGLISNTILVRYIFIAFIAFTGFVFGMFYYRFFQSTRIQFGCFKTFGFKDKYIRFILYKVTICISLLGAVIGLCGGYFASDVLLRSSWKSYMVIGIVKGISPVSVIIGLFVPGAVFCLITRIMFYMIQGKEAGELLMGRSSKIGSSISIRLADKVSEWFPEKKRLSVRLALRNPVAALLILIAVAVVLTMFILAYSLNISSGKIFETQTMGHYYLYETCYEEPQKLGDSIENNRNENMQNETDYYLTANGLLKGKGFSIEGIIAGGSGIKEIYELFNEDGDKVPFPQYGEIIIGCQWKDLYGIKEGDQITVRVKGQEKIMKVAGMAYNAKQGWGYVSKEQLCEMLSLPQDSYTYILSRENMTEGGSVITKDEKMDVLERGMVSNRVSAVINQVIGCVIGCILLFLALFLNFQSSTRDILILQLMGYRMKEIGSILIDIYKPIIFAAFLLTLFPAMQLTKHLLRSLSIQIGDYMMFETNIFVIVGILILLYIIYFVVLSLFLIRISKITKNETTAEEL